MNDGLPAPRSSESKNLPATAMPIECPSDDMLRRFLSGELASSAMEVFTPHFEACPRCQDRAEALEGSIQPLPRMMPETDGTKPPILSRLIKELHDCDPRCPAGGTLERLPLTGALPVHFGDYEILAEIGRGGMGVVYRARQISLNRSVALKVIAAGQLASPSEVRRFRNEAEAAARLDHPNIVPVYETGEDDHRHFLSMKLVDGAPLSQAMEDVRSQRSPLGIALLLARVARALHYAHQRGVLHRDVKPGNILLDAAGDPHLTDFGLAKLMDEDHGLTRSQSIMGTPNYLAPEIASGETKSATIAADVYGLGAVLYEILAGHPPFACETLGATLQKILTTEPRPLRETSPAVPRDLETICLKAMAKTPALRYATAMDLAEDLESFSRHEPIAARPTSLTGKLVRWCRRQPALAASLLALGFIFLLGFAGVFWKWNAEVDQRRFAEQEGRRAQQAVTRLEIERAESLLNTGDSGRGLAYLARLLRQEPANRVVAERLMSALTSRSYCLPIAPLRHGKALHSLAEDKRNSFAFHFDGSVVTAEISPDGTRVVTASEDGTARLWNADTGEPLGQPMSHTAEVLSARFSDNGQQVVTASADGSARIWGAFTGEPAAPALQHDDLVRHADFSPDGGKVVTASRDRSVRVWNSRTGEPAGPTLIHPKTAYFVCFSQDGSRILTADESDRARLWDAASGAAISESLHFHFPQFPAPFPQFSPSENRVATLSYYYAYLLDSGTFKSAARVEQDNFLTGAVYGPENWRLATVSEDTTARLWQADTGKPSVPPLRHDGAVMSAHFSQDGQRLVTASRDKSARLWEVRSGQSLAEPLRHDSAVLSAKIGTGGQRVVTISESDSAWLWDVRAAQPLTTLRWLVPPVAVVARFSPDGQRLLVVDQAAAVGIWDAHSGLSLTPTLKHPNGGMTYDARFSPDNRLLVTTSELKTAQLFDTATGERFGHPMDHHGEVRQARFSPDGKRLATASEDATAKVWEVASCRLLLELKHDQAVTSVEFSPDGARIVTASRDATARLWDAATGAPLAPPLKHDHTVYRAIFDPAGQRVATASKDKTVCLWSVRTGGMLTPPLVHADALNPQDSVIFSPDGSRVVTAAGSSAQVWNAASGAAVTVPLRHGGMIRSLQFSPDGRKILTASEDGLARLWDPESGHPVSEPMKHGSGVTSAEFSPDGMRVVTCSPDRAVRLWEVTRAPLPAPAWLPALAEAVAGQRINAHDVSEVQSVEALYEMRRRLAANTDSDDYGRWARWFFADSATRTISPSARLTVPDYVTLRVGDRTRESIHEAARVSSTNAMAIALLAKIFAGSQPPVAPGTYEDADWLSRYAATLAPDDTKVQEIRAAVMEKLRTSAADAGFPRDP